VLGLELPRFDYTRKNLNASMHLNNQLRSLDGAGNRPGVTGKKSAIPAPEGQCRKHLINYAL